MIKIWEKKERQEEKLSDEQKVNKKIKAMKTERRDSDFTSSFTRTIIAGSETDSVFVLLNYQSSDRRSNLSVSKKNTEEEENTNRRNIFFCIPTPYSLLFTSYPYNDYRVGGWLEAPVIMDANYVGRYANCLSLCQIFPSLFIRFFSYLYFLLFLSTEFPLFFFLAPIHFP